MADGEETAIAAVFQGGVAQLSTGAFVAELNTARPVALGSTGDLWDAIELFVAGLRHCQSMLRGDGSVTMEAVTTSLENAVARGGLQQAVEASLAAQALAHRQSLEMHAREGGFGARGASMPPPGMHARAHRSGSLSGAEDARPRAESSWRGGRAMMQHEAVALPSLDGMQSDASDLPPAVPADDDGTSAAAALASMASSGRRKRSLAAATSGGLSDGGLVSDDGIASLGREKRVARARRGPNGVDVAVWHGQQPPAGGPLEAPPLAPPPPLAQHEPSPLPSTRPLAAAPATAQMPAAAPTVAKAEPKPAQSRGRTRGSFVSSLARTARVDVHTAVDPATGRRTVTFGVPSRYMDLQDYDEKTSGRLPVDVIRRLKQWMVDHWANPYPNEPEKADIAAESGMTLQQVSNWFRNERKRVWLPLKRRAEEAASALGATA